MNQPASPELPNLATPESAAPVNTPADAPASASPLGSDGEPLDLLAAANQPQPSYVKLAMRNMVKKGGKSLYHFTLTTVGLAALFVALAYLTR